MSQIFNTSLDIKGNVLVSGTISKVGGTSSQFLKADGSVDSSTYQTVGATHYIGTTSIANNRASAAQTLTGVNINGSIDRQSNNTITDLNIVSTENGVLRFDTFAGTATNKPVSVNNANGVISMFTNHGTQYGKQIAFATDDDLYIRNLNGGIYQTWRKIWHNGNFTNLNQLTTRNFSDLQNKPTTIAGYGITDAIITGTGTAGYVSFWNAASTQIGSSSFFWDNTNKYLGIGTNAPQTQLHVNSAASVGIMRLQGLGDADNYSVLEMWDDTGASKWQFAHKLYAGQTKDFSFTHWNGTSWIAPILFKDNGRILINKTTGDDGVNQLQINGYSIATGFRIPSGLSTQYLMADGSTSTGGSGDMLLGTDQTVTSLKTFTNTTSTQTRGLDLTNNGTTGSHVLKITNNSSGTGVYLLNTVAGGTGFASANSAGTGISSVSSGFGTAISVINSGAGIGMMYSNNSTGIGFQLSNASSGNAIVVNNATSATGIPFTIQKNSVDTLTINDNGEVSGNKFTKVGGLPTEYLMADGSTSTGGGGSPAGSDTQIQYNNAGAFGANVDFVWNNSLKALKLLGSDTEIVMKCVTNEPPTPTADTLAIYTKKMGGKAVVKTKDEFGVDFSLQTSFWDNNIVMWNCTNATAGLWIGTVGTTAGSFANTLPSSGSLSATIKRALYSNVVTTANQVLGVYGSENLFFIGPAPSFGGFYFYSRFTFDVWSNGGRLFTGLSAVATATAIITSNPSTATNIHTCGFAVDDTNAGVIYFITNNGTTTTKQIVSGIPPIISNRAYDTYIYCAPNGNTIYWRIEDLVGGTTVSGSQTLTLPGSSSFMRPYCVASNAALTPVNSIRLGVNKIYLETDY